MRLQALGTQTMSSIGSNSEIFIVKYAGDLKNWWQLETRAELMPLFITILRMKTANISLWERQV